jgi:hypothetical protein
MKKIFAIVYLLVGSILTIIAMITPGVMVLTTAVIGIKGLIMILGGTILVYLPESKKEK